MARKEKENPRRSAPAEEDVLGVPAKTLKEYVKFFEKNNLKELTIRERGTTISLKKDEPVAVWGAPVVAGPVPAPSVAAPSAEAEAPAAAPVSSDEDRYDKVTSPIIGTFYEAPSPGADPFVKEGQTVSKGTPLCIIEAMKVMNRISAEFDCRIVRKVAQNGQPVKSGETLFLVERL